jgi:hypothetical protein
LFREDNLAVYYKLEEATRATAYAASIKPYLNEGRRDAWLPVNQYAGKTNGKPRSKYEQLLHTR